MTDDPWVAARVDRTCVVFRVPGGEDEVVDRARLDTQDWVTGDRALAPDGSDGPLRRLPRTTELRRARNDGSEQVLAANVDVVFLVVPENEGARPSVVERLAVIGWDSGASPVLLITKSDLAEPDRRREIEGALMRYSAGIPWVFTSSETGEGLEDVRRAMGPGNTAVLIGHSGVGKSRLVNELARAGVAATGSVRERDGKGRHTTTSRQLVPVDGTGSLIIDTPGIRELGAPAGPGSIEDVFPEIASVADRCRFSDCAHRRDAGCAVRAALADGTIDRGRLRRFLALLEETEDPRPAHVGRRDKTTEYARLARSHRAARGH